MAIKKKKKRHVFSTILMVILFLFTNGVLMYPTIRNMLIAEQQTQEIKAYGKAADSYPEEEVEKLLAEAQEYNEELLRDAGRFLRKDISDYLAIMDVTGTGIMGKIDIPKIRVSLPIYHTVDETVLQVGIGHLPGSSFPIGGKGTHAVLSGHRGLISANLFTQLDVLQIGDTFDITVLRKTRRYAVDQIVTVLPEQMEELAIDENEEYVTLVTCTPYGINSHRLLVRGRFQEEVPVELNEEYQYVTSTEIVPVDRPLTYTDYMAFAAVVITAITVLALIVKGIKKAVKKHNREKIG